MERALALRGGGDGYTLVTVDYGREFPLATSASAEEAVGTLLEYVDRELPAPRSASAAELNALAAAADPHYTELAGRLGQGSLLISLPAELVLDRIGALDGVYLFPAGTPVEARSLPPTSLRDGARLHRFTTAGDVLVHAELVAPWFGQPGGGLRFRLAEDFRGIRDLVVTGALQRLAD
ncbi:TNT domain-containing protein [Agromyces larvae]|uniref:TNT domain-containing protein n=1 Tax=Agromyces larvae TaxID=2929802 RepID=A0ABY4BY89_9MICO|nr:TNT domain-containing protein [Agromyces larvae]UOE42641.1 TNT domain-containing protein [Agromyces larvae]